MMKNRNRKFKGQKSKLDKIQHYGNNDIVVDGVVLVHKSLESKVRKLQERGWFELSDWGER